MVLNQIWLLTFLEVQAHVCRAGLKSATKTIATTKPCACNTTRKNDETWVCICFAHLGSSFVDRKSLTRDFQSFPIWLHRIFNESTDYKLQTSHLTLVTFSPKNNDTCNCWSNKDSAGGVVGNYPKTAAKKLCFLISTLLYFTLECPWPFRWWHERLEARQLCSRDHWCPSNNLIFLPHFWWKEPCTTWCRKCHV